VSTPIYRPLVNAGEYPLFHAYVPPPTSGVGARSRTFDEYVADGDYPPEWVWIAERDGQVIARAAFWAPPGSPVPWGVDYFDPGVGADRVEIGAALLRAAYAALVPPDYAAPPHPDTGRPDYHLFLPADWRERPEARADATDRIAAAELAGLNRTVERLNLRWTVADGLPPRSGRLRFVPAADRHDELLAAVMRVNTATLDAHARDDVVRLGAREAAMKMLREGETLPYGVGRRWWRLAFAPDGDTVGFVLPARNPSPSLWYIGVVPEHRGHQYSDDLVTEALHIFTDAGEAQVDDNTDLGNAPMAASFDRCGYRVIGRRIVFV
jgi:ribosomal protein S18 acetylase RimI-like enzyme